MATARQNAVGAVRSHFSFLKLVVHIPEANSEDLLAVRFLSEFVYTLLLGTESSSSAPCESAEWG